MTWETEYDWEVPSGQPTGSSISQTPRNNFLCILFDSGAQREFSKIRITLYCNNDVPQHIRDAWQVTPEPMALSVTNRVSSESGEPNASSLPTYHATFVANLCPLPPAEVGQRGEVTLMREGFPGASLHTIFELEQALTENTQSVFVSFTSSRWLNTLIPRGHYFHANTDRTLTMGRVVHVFPTTPVLARKAINLPKDVLPLVFENVFDAIHKGWRKDLMSCALVCHDWTGALDFLLSDFRSSDTQLGNDPPEIVALAAAITDRPDLSRFIKHLSIDYFERHLVWTRDLKLKLPMPYDPTRRSHFVNAFISIVRCSQQHLQTFNLSLNTDLLPFTDNLPHAVLGLAKLESLTLNRGLTMVELLTCLPTWPTLKRLTITAVNPRDEDTDANIPTEPPACSLTELKIMFTPIRDDELTYLVSSSSQSLQRLSFNRVTSLTNAGLLTALRSVSKSLTFLYILGRDPRPHPYEEHALDAVIAEMERLERLEIFLDFATTLMVERRSKAFKYRTEAELPELELKLIVGRSQNSELPAVVQSKQWPGWKSVGLDGRQGTLGGR